MLLLPLEILIEKSTEFNIDLNTNVNPYMGYTYLHIACNMGCSKTAELIMKKCATLKIDINAKGNKILMCPTSLEKVELY